MTFDPPILIEINIERDASSTLIRGKTGKDENKKKRKKEWKVKEREREREQAIEINEEERRDGRSWKKGGPARGKVASVPRPRWLRYHHQRSPPEPQVIREKVATQMWASVSIDYRETVAAPLLLAKEKIFLSTEALRRRKCQKCGWILRGATSRRFAKAFASLIRNGGNFNSAGPETAEIFAALSSSLSKQLRETTAEEAL